METKRKIWGWKCPSCGSLTSLKQFQCLNPACDFIASQEDIDAIKMMNPYHNITIEERERWEKNHKIIDWAYVEYKEKKETT